MTDPRAQELLDFWFGEQRAEAAWLDARQALWFRGGADTDATLRTRFGALWVEACAGRLDGWAQAPRELLALVLLLDQLSRNLARGTPAAFAQDARARELVHQAHARGWEAGYTPLERTFLAMPLEHSESLADQEACVRTFEALRAQARGSLAPAMEGFLDYARRHRDIVARFGRFPHRNAVLGRASTPEEVAFLREPGNSF